MRMFNAAFLMLCVGITAGSVYSIPITDAEIGALNWEFQADLTTDHSGGSGYSVYGMSCAMANGYLYVAVHTNFPQTGLVGSDSYSFNNLFDPGDLYINVGGSFQDGTGNPFGVATTSHGNNVAHAYGSWGDPVVQGSLYTPLGGGNPFFANGTWEVYEASIGVVDPSDGDGSILVNSYPTMIRYGTEVATDVAGMRYLPNSLDPWAFDIFYKVDVNALNYDGSQEIQLFWAMECGNDGVQIIKAESAPEPNTLTMLAVAGFLGLVFPKKKRL